MAYCSRIMTLAVAGMLAASANAGAIDWTTGYTAAGRPPAALADKSPLAITGFGTARFGMSAEQALAAAAVDLKLPLAAFTAAQNEPGLIAISAIAPTLYADGPVRISYVFDSDADRLVRVFLTWDLPGNPGVVEREALIARAGNHVAPYIGRGWRLFSPVVGRPLGPNAIAVFAATDDRGNGVDIRLGGVEFSATFGDGTVRRSPPATGPAVLRIGFVEDMEGRMQLKPGAF